MPFLTTISDVIKLQNAINKWEEREQKHAPGIYTIKEVVCYIDVISDFLDSPEGQAWLSEVIESHK